MWGADLLMHQSDGEVGRIHAVLLGGGVLRQEGHEGAELQRQREHGRVQQRLAPGAAVVRGGVLQQVGLQVAQAVRPGLAAAACTAGGLCQAPEGICLAVYRLLLT